jgi:radical SAM protein with 4Fe4S-binding SPASM domain
LRPINYQGFARRTPPAADDIAKWNGLHARFIDLLIERNFSTGNVMEEFYFSLCLRRLLRAAQDGHVDLRNPSFLGTDYLVIDYDGRLYPTDEARMLSRVRHVDLSIGTAATGIDRDRVTAINGNSFNNLDPDCIHCAYQPFCGSDPIDNVSRYGRVDVPRADTWFCSRHLSIFDRIVMLLYSTQEKDRFSLAHWAGIASWPPHLSPRHDPPTYQS